MPKGFAVFRELLRRRFEANVFTTEDSVRYTFFAALLRDGLLPEQVILEFPHPLIQRARIDTVIVDGHGAPAMAIEFKYDRRNPGGTNQPMPQKAGSAFADLARLLLFPPPCERYFVYLTDGELARYLDNPRNGLQTFFSLRQDQRRTIDSQFFAGRSATFLHSMGEWPRATCTLRGVINEDLPQNHHLRVYEIEPTVGG